MLVGSITTDGIFDRGDFVVTPGDVRNANGLFANAGLDNGGRLPGMIGYEAQSVFSNYPKWTNEFTLAESVFKSHYSASPIIPLDYPKAAMSLYSSAAGALVFSSGSTDWSFGLDIFSTDPNDFPSTPYFRVHPAIGQITRNVLHQFGDGRDPGSLGTEPAYSVSITSSSQTQVCVRYTRPANRPQSTPQSDFIALHQVQTDDDQLVSYRTPDCNVLGRGDCCISGFKLGPTYTADYVTLDKFWHRSRNEPNDMRTIWRAAQRLPVTP